MNATELKAGRELDARVAERVMGWTPANDPVSAWLTDKMELRTWDDSSYQSFRPSTDIAAAWQVVEKFQASGFDVTLALQDRQWNLGIFNKGETEICDGEADTAPLAICLAALKWAEGQ